MPLLLPGLLAGAITAFSAALGEFGAVITFVSNIPGKPAPCRSHCIPLYRNPAASTPRRGSRRFPLVLGLADLLLSEWFATTAAAPPGPLMLRRRLRPHKSEPCAWRSGSIADSRRGRAVRTVRLRQKLDDQHHRRPAGPRIAAAGARRDRAVRRGRRSTWPPNSADRLRLSRRQAVPAS